LTGQGIISEKVAHCLQTEVK
jgi:hypothetical protein